MRGDEMALRAPVGVGRAGAATPTGRFYVRNRLTTYRTKAYGPVAFGTSARSADLTDWPAGGYIDIMAPTGRTSSPAASPTDASGCATRTSGAWPDAGLDAGDGRVIRIRSSGAQKLQQVLAEYGQYRLHT